MRLGEMSNTLYMLVIEYTEARAAQTDLANMPSVQSGTLYQIDVKDGNNSKIHNFHVIDRTVEIYDVKRRIYLNSFSNAVKSVLSAEPDLVQLTYQAAGTQLIFTIDQTAIRNVIRGYMPMGFVILFSCYSFLGTIVYFVLKRY